MNEKQFQMLRSCTDAILAPADFDHVGHPEGHEALLKEYLYALRDRHLEEQDIERLALLFECGNDELQELAWEFLSRWDFEPMLEEGRGFAAAAICGIAYEPYLLAGLERDFAGTSHWLYLFEDRPELLAKTCVIAGKYYENRPVDKDLMFLICLLPSRRGLGRDLVERAAASSFGPLRRLSEQTLAEWKKVGK